MKIQEKAKALLLGKTCETCQHLDKNIKNISEIKYDKITKQLLSQNLDIVYRCKISHPDKYKIKNSHIKTCFLWLKNSKNNNQYSIVFEDWHI